MQSMQILSSICFALKGLKQLKENNLFMSHLLCNVCTKCWVCFKTAESEESTPKQCGLELMISFHQIQIKHLLKVLVVVIMYKQIRQSWEPRQWFSVHYFQSLPCVINSSYFTRMKKTLARKQLFAVYYELLQNVNVLIWFSFDGLIYFSTTDYYNDKKY